MPEFLKLVHGWALNGVVESGNYFRLTYMKRFDRMADMDVLVPRIVATNVQLLESHNVYLTEKIIRKEKSFLDRHPTAAAFAAAQGCGA